MSRNLRLAHLPAGHTRLRFSGYLTAPVTDQQLAEALGVYFVGLKLYRDRAALPPDWPTRDEVAAPAGRTAIWGEGDDISSATVIGDPETPWRLLVGQGQLVIDNVWLYDAAADPWPTAMAACPPCMQEAVRPPSCPVSEECHATAIGVVGVLLGAALGGTAVLVWRG